MLRYLVLLFLVALAPSTFAAVWGTNTTVTGYYVYDNGGSFIKVANMENPDGCASINYLALDTNAPYFQALYATVMAAYASQQTVTVNYHGCLGSYPKVRSVAVPASW
jgi:hypothetical protein